MAKKEILSDIDEFLIPDVSSLIGEYINEYELEKDRCSMLTDKGNKCIYQSEFTKDVTGDDNKISCKHYCRKHCSNALNRVMDYTPLTVVLLINNEKYSLHIDNHMVLLIVEAGGGKIVYDYDQGSYNPLKKKLIMDKKQLISRWSGYNLCPLLAEYDEVKFSFKIKLKGPDINYKSIKFITFETEGKEQRWIASPPAWIVQVTKKLHEKFIYLTLEYTISHKDNEKEVYTHFHFEPRVIYDTDKKSNKKMDKELNKMEQHINDTDNELYITKFFEVIDSFINEDEFWLNTSDAKRVRNIMIKLHNDPKVSRYDKSRIENRYTQIFGYSIKDKPQPIKPRYHKEFVDDLKKFANKLNMNINTDDPEMIKQQVLSKYQTIKDKSSKKKLASKYNRTFGVSPEGNDNNNDEDDDNNDEDDDNNDEDDDNNDEDLF